MENSFQDKHCLWHLLKVGNYLQGVEHHKQGERTIGKWILFDFGILASLGQLDCYPRGLGNLCLWRYDVTTMVKLKKAVVRNN